MLPMMWKPSTWRVRYGVSSGGETGAWAETLAAPKVTQARANAAAKLARNPDFVLLRTGPPFSSRLLLVDRPALPDLALVVEADGHALRIEHLQRGAEMLRRRPVGRQIRLEDIEALVVQVEADIEAAVVRRDDGELQAGDAV